MNPPSGTATSTELAARYRSIRGVTDALAQPLSAEDCALQSAPFTSPVKWHLAHTSWFFETFVLGELAPGYRSPSPEYRVLFNSYYHAIGARHPRPERGLLSRPGLDEVRAYRRHVDRAMGELLASAAAARDPRVATRTELGLQHEQQHQELLLTDVKHLFWKNPLRPAYRATPTEPAAASRATHAERGGHTATPGDRSPQPRGWVAFAGGEREVGDDGARAFAYDNEGPRHRVLVPPFELCSGLVTNGDWLAFLDDGGYRRSELWLSAGFDLVQAERLEAPLYWERDGAGGGEWTQFTLDGMRALDPDEPLCHVSLFEADAFARWAGARLPTEFEWETAASERGDARPDDATDDGGFLECGALHPRRPNRRHGARHRGGGAGVPGTVAADGAVRAEQLFGQVWQWTRSAYSPYPGYRAADGALGEYNGKFMVNQLVLRGGACVSPRSHLRASYRNFFHPHDRWQFMGLRLARDAQ